MECKAVVYDRNKVRREAFNSTLKCVNWECDPEAQVYEKNTKAFLDSGEHDLIMLHLRGPDDTQDSCGNGRSWEFLITKLATMPNAAKTCLIAYSGGGATGCPEPIGFSEFRDKGWPWVYFNGVNGPQDINLKEFANAWKAAPTVAPPLRLLRTIPQIPQVDALKLLILGYQVAHGCGNESAIAHHGWSNPTEARSWTESFDWWLPVLGKDLSVLRVQKLIEVLSGKYARVATDLAEFYRHRSENINVEFPEGLHKVLCEFSLGSKGAA